MIDDDLGSAGGRGGGSSPQSDAILALARRAVETYVRSGQMIQPDLPAGGGPERAGVFVSLHEANGALRGCLGTFLPTKRSLAEEIVANAVNAASRDPRFFPVTRTELEGLHVSVDILEEPEEIDGPEHLDPERYGLLVRTDDGRQALLLPHLEGVDSVERQLVLTCRKGGIDPWKDRYHLYRFRVERHEEPASPPVPDGV